MESQAMFCASPARWSGNVEAVIGNLPAVFRLPPSEIDALKVELVRDSFAHHYRANPWFRGQCDRQPLTPDDLHEIADLQRIPLIPVQTFKRPDAGFLLSVPLDAIDLEIQSTGTSGFPSVARRDAVTTTRASLALLALYREFFGIARGVGLMLCPSPAEAPEMGMVKVFNLLTGLLDDRAYLVRDYAFDPSEAVQYLRSWTNRQTRHVLGPPFLVNRLLAYLEKKDLRLPLDPGSFAITLGGWKRFNRERICRSVFDRKLETYLGIQPGNSRDMYGMIESNLLAVECEHHRKHLPPWCHVTVRDVNDFSVELAAGAVGVIGILDTLSRSYPGFLLSEDVGRVEAEPCPCGRSGQVISFVRRLRGAELGCCAVTIERHMAGKEGKR
jgi:long-chain-fatty-acid---luciferin-component ligase